MDDYKKSDGSTSGLNPPPVKRKRMFGCLLNSRNLASLRCSGFVKKTQLTVDFTSINHLHDHQIPAPEDNYNYMRNYDIPPNGFFRSEAVERAGVGLRTCAAAELTIQAL